MWHEQDSCSLSTLWILMVKVSIQPKNEYHLVMSIVFILPFKLIKVCNYIYVSICVCVSLYCCMHPKLGACIIGRSHSDFLSHAVLNKIIKSLIFSQYCLYWHHVILLTFCILNNFQWFVWSDVQDNFSLH